MGEMGDSRCNLGLGGSAKNSTSPANLASTLNHQPRFEIRVENGRFFTAKADALGNQEPIRIARPTGLALFLLNRSVNLMSL